MKIDGLTSFLARYPWSLACLYRSSNCRSADRRVLLIFMVVSAL